MTKRLRELTTIIIFLSTLYPVAGNGVAEQTLNLSFSYPQHDCVTAFSLNITNPQEIYMHKEKITYAFNMNKTKLKNKIYSLTYGITDLFGKPVRAPRETTRLTPKSFTPSLKTPTEIYVIRAELHQEHCESLSTEHLLTLHNPSVVALSDDVKEGGEEGPSTPSTKRPAHSPTSFVVQDLPERINSGEVFPLSIHIKNDASPHTFTLWSYVYKGNTCYSCNHGKGKREDNQLVFLLKANEARNIALDNLIDKGIEGDYLIKVKLVKDNQKTPKTITKNIYVTSSLMVPNQTIPVRSKGVSKELMKGMEKVTEASITVEKVEDTFLSKTAKIKKGIPYFLIFPFLLFLGLLWKGKLVF
jgi:hypothetical protein